MLIRGPSIFSGNSGKEPRRRVEGSNNRDQNHVSLKLFAFSFIQGIVNGIWGFLSIFLLDLGGSGVDIGLLAMVPGLASTFMQMAWGRISDRMGRSWRMVSSGFLVTSLLSVPVILSTRPWHVIVAASVQSLLGSIAGVAVTVRLSEILEPSRRARFMGVYNPMGFAGNILGSFFAGVMIPVISYRYTFLSYTALNLGIAVLVRYGLQESEEPGFRFFPLLRTALGELGVSLRGLPGVMRRGGPYTLWCLGISVRGFGIALFGPVLTVYLVRVLEASKPQIGALNSMAFALRLVLSPPLGWVADRKGAKRIMLSGLALAMAFPVAVTLTGNVAQMVPVYALNGVYWAFIETTWFAWQMSLIPGERGTYAGLLNFMNGLAWAFGPLLGGFLVDRTPIQVSAAVSSACVLAGLAIMMKVPERAEQRLAQV